MNNDHNITLNSITTYQSGVRQTASNRALKRFTDNALKEYGLTTMQWFVVGTVLDAGENGMSMTELSKKLDTTLAFITHNINLLEAKGIVIRVNHDTDNRSRMVHIPAASVSLCMMIEEKLRDKMRQSIYSKISRSDLQTYIKVLYKLSDFS